MHSAVPHLTNAAVCHTALLLTATSCCAALRPVLLQSMTLSQVQGGFWSNMPPELGPLYGTRRRDISMLSDDQAHREPGSFVPM